MAKILLAYIGYPDSLGRHMKNELRRMGHDVTHIGPFSKGFIPWSPERDFTEYADKPDIPLDYPGVEIQRADFSSAGNKYDLILELDSSFFLSDNRGSTPKAIWAIDNHVRDYHQTDANFFFGGHSWGWGSDRKDFHWLPSCYDPAEHFEVPILAKQYHMGFYGVMYGHRRDLINRLGEHGYIITGQGVFRDEYNIAYNQCYMGMCLSARGDVPHRVFENAAQGLLIFADNQPDLPKLGLVDGENCVIFKDLLQDPIDKFNAVKDDPVKMLQIAQAGKALLAEHTYQSRIREILKVTGIAE